MQLQELKTDVSVQQSEVTKKRVQVFLRSSFYHLNGDWQWDLESDAVFCSDVMFSLPLAFTGTRAIFHPDDTAAVRELLLRPELNRLSFRIITTYGEVKTLTGRNISVSVEDGSIDNLPQQSMKAYVREQEQKQTQEHLRLIKEIGERSVRFSNTGKWYYNAATHQTWYADFVFRLHGLAPQSLNPHLHTFQPFVHLDDQQLVTEFFDKSIREQLPLHLEYRILVNGQEKWVGFKSQWFYNTKGEAILGGIYQDITGEKTTEKEIEDCKTQVQFQRQQLLFDEQQVSFGHWQVNLLTRKTTYSDHVSRIFGLKAQNLPATISTFLNYVHPDDRDRVEDAYKQVIHEHATPELEYRIIRSDGKIRHILQKAKLLIVDQEPVVSGIIQDVTVQRLLEKKVLKLQEKLRQNAWLLQQANETSNSVSWVMDLEEKTIDWSDSFYHLLGFVRPQPQTVSEKTLFSILHPHDAKTFKASWNRVVHQREGSAFEFRIMHRGSVHFMKAVFEVANHNGKEYFIGTMQNTTGEHVLQQQLSQRVQLAESLSENIPDRVLITDRHNNILFWNRSCESAYQLKKAEAIGENFFDVFPYLKTEAQLKLLQRAQKGERLVEESMPSYSGTGYFNLHLIPLYQGDEVSGVLHIIQDVTRETELRNSLHDRLRLIESLVQSSVDRIIALDHNMNYLYWNKRAEEYYGLKKEEVLGKNILEIFPRLLNELTYGELRRALKGETVHLAADADQQQYFETYLIPIKNEQDAVVSLLWIAHDLTSELQLQEERRKAQQLLQEEHRRLKEAQAIGRIGSFEWNAETDVIHWSDEMYRIHGLEPQSEVITLDRVLSFLHPDEPEKNRSQLLSLREQPSALSMVHKIVRSDGVVRDVVRKLQSFGDEQGRVTHLSGTVQDITEQRKAEQQLKEQSHYLQRITETVPDMISIMELPSRKLHFLNGDVFQANGFRPEDMREKPRSELVTLVHPDDRAVLDAYYEILSTASDEEITTAEYRAKTDTGEWKWFLVRGKVFQRDALGRATQILNVIENITQKKQKILELAESKELLQSVFNSIKHVITVFAAVRNEQGEVTDFRYVRTNESGLEYEGCDPAGRLLCELHPGFRETSLLQNFKTVVETGEPADFEFHLPSDQGSGTWFRVKAVKLGDGLVAAGEDITKRRLAEAEIKKNLTILQHTEEMAQTGSWEYRIATGKFSWSEGLYRLFEIADGHIVQPEIYLEYALAEDRSVAKRIYKNLRHLHQPFEETIRIKTRKGSRLLKLKASVVHNKGGEAERMIGVVLDLTDIKEAQEKMALSQHWLEQTALASPDSITVYDLQTKQPVYLNSCLAEWIGTTSDELVRMGVDGRLQLILAEDRLRLLHFQAKVKDAGDGEILNIEYRLHAKNDSIIWLRNRSKVFLRDDSGQVTHILSILQDITEEKAAERMLKSLNTSLEKQNAELQMKNEEITSFAFVASHDLKEPVRKIYTFSDWLLTHETGLSETGRASAEKLSASVRRLDLLISDILALTKVHAGNERLKTVDLNRLLEQVKTEMQAKLEISGAVIEAGNLPAITGAINQLFFLFKNLISNAIKFQPADQKPVIRIWAEVKDAYLQLHVADNGLGIAPEYHKKIFEIFRRLHNRETFEGTGMGLAICKKIMEKHGGQITVESQADEGAVFTCWFPAALVMSRE